MLADQLDYVVGVDPHRDSHALAVVHVVSGAVVFEASIAASSEGYAHALSLVDEHAAGRRAFAVEGTGSFGAGLTRFLGIHGERVLEVGRLRRERRSGGKTDALDAIRAARSVLAQQRPATPRAGGEREALRALMVAREGAVERKTGGTLSAAESPRHNTRAAPHSAAPADQDTVASTAGGNTTRAARRSGTTRRTARTALGRTTLAATDQRRT